MTTPIGKALIEGNCVRATVGRKETGVWWPIVNLAGNKLVAITAIYSKTGKDCDGLRPFITQVFPFWLANQLRAEV